MSFSLFKTAGLIAFLTILSKFVGFARDLFIANAYGATLVSDAYFYAYQIPALALVLLGGMGGPFHSATVAFFAKKITDIKLKISNETLNVFNSFLTLTAFVFLILSLVVFMYPEQILNVIAAKAGSELILISSELLRIMSPIVFIGGLIGVFYGISVVYKEFFIPSLSPVLMSLAIIGALVFFPNDPCGKVLAFGFLVGGLLQFLVLLFPAFKKGIFYKPTFHFFDGNLFKISEVLAPAILASSIGQINIYVDMFFTSGLQEGAWSAISYSNRLFQFPAGVIVTAFLVPLFPMFSNFVGKKDFESLRKYFFKGLNTLWLLAFPIFVFIILFAQDIIYILFERGAFNHKDTLMVAQALTFLSISIIPYVARDTLTRVFYSFDDSKTPFFIAGFSILVKVIMNSLLVKPFGIAGVTASTSIVAFSNMFLLAIFLKNKVEITYKQLLSPVIKMLFASLCMFTLGSFLMHYFIFSSKILIMFKLLAVFIVCLALYLFICLLLKIPAMHEIIGKIKKHS